MRRAYLVLAGFGWLCLLTWLAAFFAGGGKNAIDYARASITVPLDQDQELLSSDQKRALWSGWWSANGGVRLSTSESPDVVFRWDKPAASSCTVYLQAYPMLAPGKRSQRLFAKINGAPLAGPIEVSSDRLYRIDDVGSVQTGMNVLTFRLPGARRANATDERLLALALRSIRFHCSDLGARPSSD